MAEGQPGTSKQSQQIMENKQNRYEHCNVNNNQVSGSHNTIIQGNCVPKKIEDLIFELPGLPEYKIVGRDKNVVEIMDLFKKGVDRRVAICGLAGMGKTMLAIYCAHVWLGKSCISDQIGLEYFRNVVYLSVESRQNFESSAKRLAKKLNVQQDQRITEIWRDILNLYKNDRLLIIIDNLVKLADVSDLLEIKDKGLYILATTQNRDIEPPFRVCMLDTISEAEGLELFLTVTEHQMDCNENTKKEFLSCFDELFNTMEGLPISVSHVATTIAQNMKSYVRTRRMEPTTENYTTLLRKYMADFNSRLREEFPEQFKTQISKSAYTALTVNIDKLSSDHSKRLLSILCYLDPADIRVGIFDEPFINKTDCESAIDGLSQYSLIYIEIIRMYYKDERVIRIHRLVQDVARTYLESEIGVNMVPFIIMSICSGKVGNLWFMIAHLGGTNKISEWFNSCSKEDLKAVVDRMFELKKPNKTLDGLRAAGCDVRDGANWPLPHKLMAMVCVSHWDAEAFFLIFDWIFKEFNAECLADAEDGLTLHHVAATNGNLGVNNIYKYLVEKGEEKDIKKGTTRRQLSPLHVVQFDYRDDVSLMVGLGADVNAWDVDGNTPLHAAARRGEPNVVDALLKQPGVQVDAENDDHETPLMVAVENSTYIYFRAVRLLMEAGARYDFRLKNGDTILHRAAKYHEDKLIDRILDRIEKDGKISVNDVNVDGDTPAHLVVSRKYDDDGKPISNFRIIRTLKQLVSAGADLNIKNNRGQTSLDLAEAMQLSEEDIDCLKMYNIINKTNARYDFRWENGDTILHRAAKYHEHKLIKCILDCIKKDAQIDVNDVNVDGDTPAHLAVSRKYRDDGGLIHPYNIFDTLEQLVRAGANVNIKNNRGETPFDLAEAMQFSEEDIDCLKICNIINNTNTRFDFRWENGDTILHRAAKYQKFGLIQCILDCIKKDAQIDVNDVNVDGDTPAHLALSRKYNDYGLPILDFYIIQTLKQLVRAGANLNIMNNGGQTPLDLAEAVQLSEEAIDYLKIYNIINKTNARYDFRWENGDTILHRAAKHHEKDLIKCILDRIKKDAQISVNDVNVDGDTPAHLALSRKYNDYGLPILDFYIIQTLKQLVRAGANLNMKNNRGQTPLDLARAKFLKNPSDYQ